MSLELSLLQDELHLSHPWERNLHRRAPPALFMAVSGIPPTGPSFSYFEVPRSKLDPTLVEQNPLPQPAGHSACDAAQDVVGFFLGCGFALLGHAELPTHERPQILLPRAAVIPFPAQTVFVLGVALTQVPQPC